MFPEATTCVLLCGCTGNFRLYTRRIKMGNYYIESSNGQGFLWEGSLRIPVIVGKDKGVLDGLYTLRVCFATRPTPIIFVSFSFI